jgi:hypothetical protein
LRVVIDGANRHDMKRVRSTLEGIMTKRPAPTVDKPQGLCMDKGYDYDEVRAIVKEFGFTAHIRARRRSQVHQTGSQIQDGYSGIGSDWNNSYS